MHFFLHRPKITITTRQTGSIMVLATRRAGPLLQVYSNSVSPYDRKSFGFGDGTGDVVVNQLVLQLSKMF
jgi:hypothetical protein